VYKIKRDGNNDYVVFQTLPQDRNIILATFYSHDHSSGKDMAEFFVENLEQIIY